MATPPAKESASLSVELVRQAGQYARLMRLDKPIGIWLLLWPTLWGLWIAAKGQPDPKIFLVFVLGVITMRSAGCVFNDFADRKIDPKVDRTSARPLAAGAVAPAEALVLFFALGLIAIALVLTLDPLTQILAIVGAILTVIYPFMKRFFSAPQLILGAAFGWGIPMAFAAQTGNIPRLAWLMWLTVIIWAVIYDTMYAMADRADDVKAGIRSTAILFGSADVFIVTLLQFILVLALVLMGAAAQLGIWYMGFLAIATALLVFQRMLIKNRLPEQCFRAFMNHHYFGAAIFAGIALDYLFKSGG
jgi:4-hydroxybenzoate polyprenyltransferase